METIPLEEQARTETVCRGCGRPKELDQVVCWNCFKFREDVIPFQDFDGTLAEWLRLLNNGGSFEITSVHRDDLEGLGYDISKVDDLLMRRLASNMADGYCEKEFWRDLETCADELGIPRTT
jgi:hypothetical protein